MVPALEDGSDEEENTSPEQAQIIEKYQRLSAASKVSNNDTRSRYKTPAASTPSEFVSTLTHNAKSAESQAKHNGSLSVLATRELQFNQLDPSKFARTENPSPHPIGHRNQVYQLDRNRLYKTGSR